MGQTTKGLNRPLTRRSARSGCHDVGENETVSLDDLSYFDWNRRFEHRTGRNDRVELAVFAARIDIFGKLPEQCTIESTPSKVPVDFLRIDAHKMRDESGRDHFLGECVRVVLPERKDAVHPGFGEPLFPVCANVFEKQIAEHDVFDALGLDFPDGNGHPRVVDFVRACIRDGDLDARETELSDLSVKQAIAYAVHRNAIVDLGDRRENTDDVDATSAPRLKQRESAVFS